MIANDLSQRLQSSMALMCLQMLSLWNDTRTYEGNELLSMGIAMKPSTALLSMIQGVPRFIASGLLGYVAVCVGYVGWMHLCENGR